VLSSHVRTALEDLAVSLYGDGLQGGDIGVLELPADPEAEPIRLTIYRRDYAALDAMATRTPPQQKRQVVVRLLPGLAPWPF
jgi:hypothetical protein